MFSQGDLSRWGLVSGCWRWRYWQRQGTTTWQCDFTTGHHGSLFPGQSCKRGFDNERPCWLSSVCKENTCSLGRDSKYGQSGLVCWRMRNELEDFWKSQHICCKEYLWKGVLDPGYRLDSCCQGRCLTLTTQDLLARVTVMSFSAGMLTGMQTVWIQYGNVVSVDSME